MLKHRRADPYLRFSADADVFCPEARHGHWRLSTSAPTGEETVDAPHRLRLTSAIEATGDNIRHRGHACIARQALLAAAVRLPHNRGRAPLPDRSKRPLMPD